MTGRANAGGWSLLRQYQSRLLDAAFVTIAALGHLDAPGHGPGALDRAWAGSMGRGRSMGALSVTLS